MVKIGRVLLFCLACAVVLASASRLMQDRQGEWSQHLIAIIACAGTIALTPLFVRWEGLRLTDVGVIPGRRSIYRVGIGFVIGLLLAILQAALVLLYGHFKLEPSPGITVHSFLSVFSLYLLLACREELAFRAYPLRSLHYAFGTWRAQLIIALVFSIEHVVGGMTWVQAFLGAGVGAILFGIAAIKTKGIALPIGLHAAWNLGQWALGFKNEQGLFRQVIENGYETRLGDVGLICYLIVMGLAILAFYYYYRSAAPRHNEGLGSLSGKLP